jgi:predicted secreted protein
MLWTSALAIFILFWVMCAFIVMPFFVRTSEEEGKALVPGQSESAPHVFRLGKTALWTTILACLTFALYYANYVNEWLTTEMLDFTKW